MWFRRTGLVTLGVLTCSGFDVTATEGPKLVCVKSVFDFGEMDNRRTVEHSFAVENAGGSPAVIAEARAGCACASATVPTNVVQPGGHAEVRARVSLHGQEGRLRKAIHVRSDDPRQPWLTLEVTGTAIPWVHVAPARLDFGTVPPDREPSADVRVSWREGLGFSVTNAASSSPAFAAALASSPDEKGHRVSVRVVRPLPPGVANGVVSVLTDDPSCPRIEVPVVAALVGDVVVAPSEIALDQGGHGWRNARYLALRSRSGKAFRVLAVDAPDPAIRWSATPMGAGGWRVELPPFESKADVAGESLRVRTDSPDSRELAVRLAPPSGL